MGLYYSQKGKFCTSTTNVEPSRIFLTSKQLRDNAAAIIIQRWWKKFYHKKLEQQVYQL